MYNIKYLLLNLVYSSFTNFKLFLLDCYPAAPSEIFSAIDKPN